MRSPASLTARFVDTVSEPGRYGDGRGGHGLILNVHRMRDGRLSRSWIQRIRIAGRVTPPGARGLSGGDARAGSQGRAREPAHGGRGEGTRARAACPPSRTRSTG